MNTTVLVGVPDLLLGSRINSVARARGAATVPTFTPHDLLSKAHGEHAWLLLIDLSAAQLQPFQTNHALKSDPHTKLLRIVAFMRQPDNTVREKAEKAGCDLVMTQDQFLDSLDDILTKSVIS